MTDEKLREIEELEKALSFLIDPSMTREEKKKSLEDSYWRAHNSGYCDFIAGQLMAGVDNKQTQLHELDSKFKYEVSRLLDLYKEQKEEEEEAIWQKASDLFEKDKKAGFEEWLRLSEGGHPRATNSVAWCYRNGYGTDQDAEKAISYFKLAVERGYYKACASLYWMYLDMEEMKEETIKYLLIGARNNDADSYEILTNMCVDGEIFSGNSRVAAFLAARAYELNDKYGYLLALQYMTGKYLPQVYPYAKYCLKNSDPSKEELEEWGITFPKFWDEIEAIKPVYPDFYLSIDSCEKEKDPRILVDKAEELMFADQPDYEGAKPYVLEAARAGLSHAMYYSYFVGIDNWYDWLEIGADKYGDINCIELLASLFTENASYRIGDQNLNKAIHYWNLRKKLHGKIPMNDTIAESYRKYSRGFNQALNGISSLFNTNTEENSGTRVSNSNENAILLRTDGSFEKIKVDFSTTEGLHEPIECDRFNIISTQKLRNLSDKLGFSVVMYCDERGMMKNLPENERAAELSGYDVLWGDVVICSFIKDLAPLSESELDEVCKLL